MKKYIIENIYAVGYERVVDIVCAENIISAHYIEYDEDVSSSQEVKKKGRTKEQKRFLMK